MNVIAASIFALVVPLFNALIKAFGSNTPEVWDDDPRMPGGRGRTGRSMEFVLTARTKVLAIPDMSTDTGLLPPFGEWFFGEFAEGNSIDVTLRRGETGSGGCLRGEVGTRLVGLGGGGRVELISTSGGGGGRRMSEFDGNGGELFLREGLGEPVPLLLFRSGEDDVAVGSGAPP